MRPAPTLIASIMLLALANCHRLPTSARTADEAVQIADAYRAERGPPAYPTRVDTQDRGDRWRVAYSRLGGGTGGLAYYDVQKATGRVIYEGGGQ